MLSVVSCPFLNPLSKRLGDSGNPDDCVGAFELSSSVGSVTEPMSDRISAHFFY